MKEISDKYIFVAAFAAVFVVILFTKYNFFELGLERDIAINLIAMIGGVVALMKYFYEKKKDSRIASIETISFFREKLMGKGNEYIVNLGSHSAKDYAVPLQTNNISELYKTHKSQIEKQMKLFGQELDTMRLLKYDILNLAEEFALKVKYNNLIFSPALIPLRKVYVDTIEQHSCVMLFVRDLQYGDRSYSNAEELYIAWSKCLNSVEVDSEKEKTWLEILKKIK
jgi:hypothetical protein